jgi:adenosylcobinamide-phosphate synthase
LAEWTEKKCRKLFGNGIFSGGIAWFLLCIAPTFLIGFTIRQIMDVNTWIAWMITILIGYISVALHSLIRHAERIRIPLLLGDLTSARKALSMIVSRETQSLSDSEIVRGSIESIGENIIDAVCSALFWITAGYLFWGLPGAAAGAVLLRCGNTLDACWGYKNEKYLRFGRIAARFDDFLHYIPARLILPAIALAALLLGGNFFTTLKIGFKHRADHPSPNSCWGMAGFAGALNICLGGPTQYGNQIESYSYWGDGRKQLVGYDILRAEILSVITTVWFTLFLCLIAGGIALCRN